MSVILESKENKWLSNCLIEELLSFGDIEFKLEQIIVDSFKKDIKGIEIKRLGGLTNENFCIKAGSKAYAVRIAGKGTENIINRRLEKINSEFASQIGINVKTIYFNEKTGFKITEFIDDVKKVSGDSIKDSEYLKGVAGLLRKLHKSKGIVEGKFNVFDKIKEYENTLMGHNEVYFEDYSEVRQQIFQLESLYRTMNIKQVPCHNDPLPENFLWCKNGTWYLIDWEYSGLNDPFWDLAAFMIEANLDSESELKFLKIYFNNCMSERDMQLILLNKIFVDFLWSIWACIKVVNGEDFYQYGLNRFIRVKENLNLYNERYARERSYKDDK